MKIFLSFIFLINIQLIFSQEVQVRFQPTLNGKVILPDQNSFWNDDTIWIENLRFYVSQVAISDEKNRCSSEQTAYLIDLRRNDQTITIGTPDGFVPSKLSFLFGTDSVTNCSGILSGDLDPALGMYWAWQSGYINFKLEGKSSLFNEREGEFTFHLGGYHAPFSTACPVNLAVNKKTIVVELPLDGIFGKLSDNMTQVIMRPCEKGSELATFVSEQFRIAK